MNRRKRFPALAHLENEEILDLLKRSSLSQTDRQIAINVLCWNMDDADNGAAVGYDRSTVGKRLRETIVPELEWLEAKPYKTKQAGA
jgi:hypothetical protein